MSIMQVSMEGTSLKLRFKSEAEPRGRPNLRRRSSYRIGVAISTVEQPNAKCREMEHSQLGPFGDTVCMWLLLRGLALRDMNCYKEAAVMFRLVTSLQKDLITVSTFLAPAALFHHAEIVLQHPDGAECDMLACALALLTRASDEAEQLGGYEYDNFYTCNIREIRERAMQDLAHDTCPVAF
jgi:hypothetical protein